MKIYKVYYWEPYESDSIVGHYSTRKEAEEVFEEAKGKSYYESLSMDEINLDTQKITNIRDEYCEQQD